MKIDQLLIKAKSYKSKGQLEAARKIYAQILAVFPQNRHAKEELKALQSPPQKQHPSQTEMDLVNQLYRNNEIDEALAMLETLLLQYPQNAYFHNLYGACCAHLEQFSIAITHYEQALQINPQYAEVHYNLGNIFSELNQVDRAIICYEKALQLDANNSDVYFNLGNSQKKIKQLDSALKSYKKALAINPNFLAAHINQGIAFWLLGEFDSAVISYQRALKIDPRSTLAQTNLGHALMDLSHYPAALQSYEQAVISAPDIDENKWNLSLAQLLTGDLEKGWENHEYRFKKRSYHAPRQFERPLWNGSSLSHKTLLLFCEQGAGDAILFLRYIKMIASPTTTVIIECYQSLHRLFLSCPEIDSVISRTDDLPYYDFYFPLLSLPKIFHTSLATIPNNIPYLAVNNLITKPLDLLKANTLNIGIVWAGSPIQKDDKRRSVDFCYFQSIADIPHTQLYSLQVGDRSMDLSKGVEAEQIIDLSPHIKDYADTAVIINQLDLVITVCTSVAHLAGALGKPVWVLLSKPAFWVWFLERDDSPWYPTARLFRQDATGHWDDVFNKVREAIKHHLLSHAKAVCLSDLLSATSTAFKLQNISEGHRQFKAFLDHLKVVENELPHEKIMHLKPLLRKSLLYLNKTDYLAVAKVLDKEIAPLL